MKTHYSLPYGKHELDFDLDGIEQIDWISPIIFQPSADPLSDVKYALDHPLGGFNWNAIQPGRSVVIAINDKTRPIPLHLLIPPLLDKLASIQPREIVIIVATGTHVPMTSAEMDVLLPPQVRRNIEIVSHDCDDTENLLYVGQTSRGTPVRINKRYLQADLKISIGNIEPHHFAGYSGGAKSIAIGLAGRETINKNHEFLLDPNSFIGIYEENPLRQDIEDIGRLAGLDCCLNTILNADLQFMVAFVGTPDSVMQAGIPKSRAICQTPASGKYDLVLASAGGFPKDINLYQAQKALTHASLFLRDGGVAVLVAECSEGMGSDTFVQFMKSCRKWEDVEPKTKQLGFRVGPHKGLQIARIAMRVKFLLVSSMEPGLVRSVLIDPAESVEQAVRMGLDSIHHPIRCAVLPHATNTIPLFSGD